MKKILFFLLLLSSALTISASCGKSQEQQMQIASVVPDQKGATVKGIIVDTENHPVEGVVVNDGTNFTRTNNKGIYYLKSDLARSRFVSVTVPSTYEITTERHVATGFYTRLSDKEKVNRRDFVLKKRNQVPEEFLYIALSDPQVKDEKQLDRFRSETVPDLNETINRFSGKEVYGVVLGDMVFDMMNLFTPYKEALQQTDITTYFHTIGNHDFDLKYNDYQNTTNISDGYGEQEYESHFGPTDYSANVGNIHIITLKNLDYFQRKKYTERLTNTQLEWLKKDLSYVKPGSIVFLNLHAPTSNKSGKGGGNTRNATELMEILKNYKVHIFAGHTHFYENAEVTPTIYEHNIGAVCGAWWAGNVNRCGAPNGYLVVQVKGQEISWFYKATGKEKTYQFRIYKPGEFLTQADYVVANVWDWDSAYSIKWYEDGVLKGSMEQFSDEDQDYITMHGKAAGYQTNHLFRARPTVGTHNITIEVTNRFGETFKQVVPLQ